jgi:hypothetical protein
MQVLGSIRQVSVYLTFVQLNTAASLVPDFSGPPEKGRTISNPVSLDEIFSGSKHLSSFWQAGDLTLERMGGLIAIKDRCCPVSRRTFDVLQGAL